MVDDIAGHPPSFEVTSSSWLQGLKERLLLTVG